MSELSRFKENPFLSGSSSKNDSHRSLRLRTYIRGTNYQSYPKNSFNRLNEQFYNPFLSEDEEKEESNKSQDEAEEEEKISYDNTEEEELYDSNFNHSQTIPKKIQNDLEETNSWNPLKTQLYIEQERNQKSSEQRKPNPNSGLNDFLDLFDPNSNSSQIPNEKKNIDRLDSINTYNKLDIPPNISHCKNYRVSQLINLESYFYRSCLFGPRSMSIFSNVYSNRIV